ncbi:hypothetical protein ACFOED_04675 [Vulcaniibacterium thermophilum]|nr:hypothetical protein [Vulcaniibacterium thermophilum]
MDDSGMPLRTLDSVTVYGDPQKTWANFSDAWWRYEFNTWAKRYGYREIPRGASADDARRTYVQVRQRYDQEWHRNSSRASTASQSVGRLPLVGVQVPSYVVGPAIMDGGVRF